MRSRFQIALIVGSFVGVASCVQYRAEDVQNRRASDAVTTVPLQVDGSGSAPTAFATQIDPILRASCGTSKCHGDASAYGVFTGNEATVKQHAAAIVQRVESGSMPQPGTPFSISSDNKAKLLAYAKSLAGAVAATPVPPPAPVPPPSPGPVGAPGSGSPTAEAKPRECPTDLVTPPSPVTFAMINSTLDKSCGGQGTCHGPGSVGRQVFIGDEAKFRDLANSTLGHLKAGTMPIGRDLSNGEKMSIFQFLCAAP